MHLILKIRPNGWAIHNAQCHKSSHTHVPVCVLHDALIENSQHLINTIAPLLFTQASKNSLVSLITDWEHYSGPHYMCPAIY